jgi:hypothetical protein
LALEGREGSLGGSPGLGADDGIFGVTGADRLEMSLGFGCAASA